MPLGDDGGGPVSTIRTSCSSCDLTREQIRYCGQLIVAKSSWSNPYSSFISSKMALSNRLAIFGLAFLTLVRLGAGAAVPYYFQPVGVSRRDLSAQEVAAELGPQLSNGTVIFGSSDPRWADATHRYNTLTPPDIQVLVEPAQESDIAKIVSACSNGRRETSSTHECINHRSCTAIRMGSNSWQSTAPTHTTWELERSRECRLAWQTSETSLSSPMARLPCFRGGHMMVKPTSSFGIMVMSEVSIPSFYM